MGEGGGEGNVVPCVSNRKVPPSQPKTPQDESATAHTFADTACVSCMLGPGRKANQRTLYLYFQQGMMYNTSTSLVSLLHCCMHEEALLTASTKVHLGSTKNRFSVSELQRRALFWAVGTGSMLSMVQYLVLLGYGNRVQNSQS